MTTQTAIIDKDTHELLDLYVKQLMVARRIQKNRSFSYEDIGKLSLAESFLRSIDSPVLTGVEVKWSRGHSFKMGFVREESERVEITLDLDSREAAIRIFKLPVDRCCFYKLTKGVLRIQCDEKDRYWHDGGKIICLTCDSGDSEEIHIDRCHYRGVTSGKHYPNNYRSYANTAGFDRN